MQSAAESHKPNRQRHDAGADCELTSTLLFVIATTEQLVPGSVIWMPSDSLPPSMHNSSEFLGLFHEPHMDRVGIATKVELSLFVLKMDGGGFDYENLYRQLGNASVGYVLSRTQFDGIDRAAYHEAVRGVQNTFRDTELNDGEGGELLLYCFLESHLKAPKVLSKMELKTANNDYIKGADGLHLLHLGDDAYQLIVGESKMIGDSTEPSSSLRKAIADAIGSVKKVRETGMTNEIRLVDSNLMKEAYSEGALTYLRSVLVPSRGGPSKQTAFGLLLGFEIDISDWNVLEMTAREFEETVQTQIMQMVDGRLDYLKQKIVDADLAGYHFYIWAIPFMKSKTTSIDQIRKLIIERI
jgi:hypothetical protein